MGMSMLWVGWFGFNAGSACGANFNAGYAMLATQVSCQILFTVVLSVIEPPTHYSLLTPHYLLSIYYSDCHFDGVIDVDDCGMGRPRQTLRAR